MNSESTVSASQINHAVNLVKLHGEAPEVVASVTGVPCRIIENALQKKDSREAKGLTLKKAAVEADRCVTIELSEEHFKKAVGRLKSFLRKKGYPVKIGQLYEAAAILHGFANWTTMKKVGFESFKEDDTVLPELDGEQE